MSRLAFYFLVLLSLTSHAQTQLKIDNAGLQLDGYLYLASLADNRKAPAIMALHGCGGMLNPQGKPNLRTVDYAKLLNAQGWHVLYLDSFTARNVKSVCGNPTQVSPTMRVSDVQAAMAYLANRADVDSTRMAILGWSHGGSTTLLSNDKSVAYPVPPVAAVAFYPGCGNGRGGRMSWLPARPLLMQLGADDDWTNPVPCQSLAAQWQGVVQQTTYDRAHHGFDSTLPVQPIALNMPTGSRTVHAGGEPAARAASQVALVEFLKGHFK